MHTGQPTDSAQARSQQKPSLKEACQAFLNEHHNMLSTVEGYLKDMIDKTEPNFANAYKPWLKGLHELCVGVYLCSKNIPLPNPQQFLESLKMFTFDGALQFLSDICESCKIKLKTDWQKRFQQDIDRVLFAASNLNRQQGRAH